MKSLLTFAVSAALAVPGLPLFAQLQDNTERQLTCENGGHDGDNVRHCEIREQSYPSIGRLNVDEVRNGAVSVKGALRGDVLVRARVETHADSQASAAIMANQVSIDGSGGQVHANGPRSGENSSWSVSYEIFVPQTSDLTVKTSNGAVAISDVRGNLRFDVNNGAVRLKRVAGDVSGTTVNGAIQADLAGGTWEGRQLEIGTHNGAVTLTTPSYYSAHIKAETGNGRIQSDFPMTVSGDLRPQNLDFNLGSGGPLIHITTSNGAIRLKHAESQ
jgi:Putative adhesin